MSLERNHDSTDSRLGRIEQSMISVGKDMSEVKTALLAQSNHMQDVLLDRDNGLFFRVERQSHSIEDLQKQNAEQAEQQRELKRNIWGLLIGVIGSFIAGVVAHFWK